MRALLLTHSKWLGSLISSDFLNLPKNLEVILAPGQILEQGWRYRFGQSCQSAGRTVEQMNFAGAEVMVDEGDGTSNCLVETLLEAAVLWKRVIVGTVLRQWFSLYLQFDDSNKQRFRRCSFRQSSIKADLQREIGARNRQEYRSSSGKGNARLHHVVQP